MRIKLFLIRESALQIGNSLWYYAIRRCLCFVWPVQKITGRLAAREMIARAIEAVNESIVARQTESVRFSVWPIHSLLHIDRPGESDEPIYRELFGSLLPTRTRPTLLTPLSAMARLPSGVDFILRTTPPPPGIAQLWNFSVLMSNRTSTLGRMADSTYQIAPLR